MPVYEGARQHAWVYLLCLWSMGATLGLLGYFDKLWQTVHSLPSLQMTFGVYAILFSLFITSFKSIAYIWAADRQGRPQSMLSLLLYPVGNAIGEGFLLLFAFDLGRLLRPLAVGDSVDQFRVASPAVPMDDPLFWNNFVWGFAPYTLLHAVLHAYLVEPFILPDHLVLDAPNTFMKAIVVAQFSYIAVYYLSGDVFMYCALRWFGDVLTVMATRMPPPGAKAPPPQKQKTK